MSLLDEEKAFDIAVRIFEANLKSGQYHQWRDLLEQVPDILPGLYDAVQTAWVQATKGDVTEH